MIISITNALALIASLFAIIYINVNTIINVTDLTDVMIFIIVKYYVLLIMFRSSLTIAVIY